MKMYFLLPAIFFIFIANVLFAQYTPLDRCVEDSIFKSMPHPSKVQLAETYLKLAKIWDSSPQKSFNYILLAMRISINENDIELKAATRVALGDYCNAKRRFFQAQEHYLAAVKQYHSNHNTKGEMGALNKIGVIFWKLKNNDASLSYYDKSLKMAIKSKDLPMQGYIRSLIGATYQQMGNYPRAMIFYNQALADYRNAGKTNQDKNVHVNIGALLLDQKRYDEAFDYYNWILKNRDTTDGHMLGTIYTCIGHVYSQHKDYKNALKYDLKALDIRQQIQSPGSLNSSLINVAGDFYLLGQADSGKYYMDRGLQMALQNGWTNLLENGYRHLYQYYLKCGAYKEALSYYHLYMSESEKISRERNKSNIDIIEANKQIQRIRESENLLLKQYKIHSLKISNQKYQFVFVKIINVLAGISMVVFLALFLLNRRVRRKMQEMNRLLSAEIMDRKAAERQTRERERQYRFLTENSVDMISQMDSQKKQVYISPSSNKMFGYTQQELMGKSPFFLTHPDFHPYAESMFNELQVTRMPRQLTYLAKKKNGTFFWVESIINPLFDLENGDFKGLVTVTRDIQERKTKEFEIMEGTKQKENLLKEIHHRVKNNFAILVSLINMQMAQSKNPELLQSLTNLQLRIRTMALVHEMLYRSKDFESISFLDYLRSLASVIAGTYNRHDIVLTFEAEETIVDIEAAIPLGLIVNEILSNAYMHAFPDSRAGKIRISLIHDRIKKTNTLVLQDDGIGMPDEMKPEQFKTMGLQIVQILCKQIDGNLTVVNNPGASFTITFQSFQN